MAMTLSSEEFLASDGVGDWRVTDGVAVARFDTGSFANGVSFIQEIGRLADAANHHPDVDLTYPHVTVHLVTHDAGNVLTDLDASVAAQISHAARELGFPAL